MIEEQCECGAPLRQHESGVNTSTTCAACGKSTRYICAESLDSGAGAGDFDGRLVIVQGPDRVGEQILLGGVPDLSIGKADDRNLQLTGGRTVSRAHARLSRVDFGPSRWRIHDHHSTNGLFVNGLRIDEQELKPGDRIQVGEYHFEYRNTFPVAPPPLAKPAPGTPICPSCRKAMPAGSKVCVECGIYIDTGKPLVISRGFDENDFATRADTWIRIVSWIVPFGLFPVASEAFATKKAYVTWGITVLTILASFCYFVVMFGDENPSPQALNMMLWTGRRGAERQRLTQLQEKFASENEAADEDRQLTDEELQEVIAALSEAGSAPPPGVEFRWYQLITHALLHAGLLHLAGNLLFLLVFGLRVNELVGDMKMAILYPLLAIGSGGIDVLVNADEPLRAGLGASGAIMGLAGMYFVFFPVQRVHMAIWFRGGILTKWHCFYKLWTVRGFWLLILWIAFNDILPMVLGGEDGVNHLAHMAGFSMGFVIAVILLMTGLAKPHGGDLLAFLIGKRSRKSPTSPPAQVAAKLTQATTP